MTHQISYELGEKAGCSAQINIADRIFYAKHFTAAPSRYFSADQKGNVEKEISKEEFEMWMGILSDSEAEAAEALKKLACGKKY
ncbi:MAG: hypothetical protein ACM3UY_08060 [Methanocella sp.]|jgi:hypothetical protein